jgi:hypothetical protein
MDTNNIPTHKLVNGVQVPLSQEEIDALTVQWATPAPIQDDSINFAQRQYNIQRMNGYMSLQVTQSALDVFLSDTATHVQGYLNGGSRLITWIETVSRNGYNATNIGFKTKTAYRGTNINGIYERAETILNILNDL